MSSYLGDYAEDFADLNFGFSTNNTSAVPTSLSGGVVSVYKSDGTTESTAGVTLSTDFDSRTGLNNVKINLSADAFYVTGEDYKVVLTAGTVGGVSVISTVIAMFSIENRFMVGTNGANTVVPMTAALSQTEHDATQTAVALIPTTPMRGTDGVDTATMRGTDSAATETKQDAGDTVRNTIAVDVAGLDGDPMRGTDNSALASALSALISTIGVAGLGLTDLGGMSTGMKAEIEAEVDDALAGLNDITVSEILTTAMTESYAADGVTNTLAQILYMILANLTEFSNAGTVRTAKRLNGSTTAGTFTYDSASAPTEITRST